MRDRTDRDSQRLAGIGFALAKLLLAAAPILWPCATLASTIFDDDWSPPKSSAPMHPPAPPAAEAQPAPGSELKAPGTQIDKPPPLVSPTQVAPAGKRPVPALAAQAASRKLFREVFAKELLDTSPAGRRALAQQLLDRSGTLADAPADHFVLLVAALKAAREASDLTCCCRAADALADSFDVDGLHAASEAALKMSLRGNSAALAGANLEAGQVLVDRLVSAEDLVTAGRLVHLLLAAGPDSASASQLQSKAKEIDSQRAALERIAPYLHRLTSAPDDPTANFAVGRYYCFGKEDWDRGLGYLAKAPSTAMGTAAQLDLATVGAPAKAIEAGDTWWNIAEKESGSTRAAIRRRAAKCYSAALQRGDVSGLRRSLVEQRVADAAPSEPDTALAGRRSALIKDDTHSGTEFSDPAPPGTVLVGLEVTTRRWFKAMVIKSVRGIYRGKAGEFAGAWCGKPEGPVFRSVAKAGYAIGVLEARMGGKIDHLTLRFMRVVGNRLDAADSYDDAGLGGTAGDRIHDVGDGKQIIGLFGIADEHCHAVGVMMRE